MGPFSDEQNYESSWTTDFAYFYNVNNIDEHISLADLNTKYIKSPEVDFSKYPQNILRDYYADKTFTPYLSKTVDLTKWLGYKYLLEDLSQNERDSQQTGVGSLADNLKPLINSPVQYVFYDIDGNGTPELIFKSSDIILYIVTSTVQTRQESASGTYGKGNITYLEFLQPPSGISVNPTISMTKKQDRKNIVELMVESRFIKMVPSDTMHLILNYNTPPIREQIKELLPTIELTRIKQ